MTTPAGTPPEDVYQPPKFYVGLNTRHELGTAGVCAWCHNPGPTRTLEVDASTAGELVPESSGHPVFGTAGIPGRTSPHARAPHPTRRVHACPDCIAEFELEPPAEAEGSRLARVSPQCTLEQDLGARLGPMPRRLAELHDHRPAPTPEPRRLSTTERMRRATTKAK